MVKILVDEKIKDGKSNFKIKKFLQEEGFNDDIIPDNRKISNRRSYLKSLILGELYQNTKGGFYTWLKNHTKDLPNASDHEMIIISHELNDTDFRLIISTKSLLRNAVKENRNCSQYLALDSTHKIVSCQFKFTTIATSTMNQKIADIAYIIHAHENSESFTYALREIRGAIKKILNFDWTINVRFKLNLLIYFSFQ